MRVLLYNIKQKEDVVDYFSFTDNQIKQIGYIAQDLHKKTRMSLSECVVEVITSTPGGEVYTNWEKQEALNQLIVRVIKGLDY